MRVIRENIVAVAMPAFIALLVSAFSCTPRKADIEWVDSKPAKVQFAKTETTVAQYRACVQAGRCAMPKTKVDGRDCNWGHAGRDNHPINCVESKQATAFCAWVNGRLPTEAEWLAEASNEGTRVYPWGDSVVTCDTAAWGGGKGMNDGCGKKSTWPVCSKTAGNSVSGLCDMSGNVLEWTSSTEGGGGVLRGGSWDYGGNANSLKASARYVFEPTSWNDSYGFRCVRSAQDRHIRANEKPKPRPTSGTSAKNTCTPSPTRRGGPMCDVPGGSFMMGCNSVTDLECLANENPYHTVNVPAFKMDRYEVSVEEYWACVKAGGCTAVDAKDPTCKQGVNMLGKSDHPIRCVSWDQARAYCSWAGKRLPTEAEWEKAARGTDGRKYPWGNDRPDCDRAVQNNPECGNKGPTKVGSKPTGASPFGTEDMLGNVQEWVEDWYHTTYMNAPSDGSAWVTPTGVARVVRGSSWFDTSTGFARASTRYWSLPIHNFVTYGFRCAMTMP